MVAQLGSSDLFAYAAVRIIPFSGVVPFCLPCIAINTPIVARRVPVFGTEHQMA